MSIISMKFNDSRIKMFIEFYSFEKDLISEWHQKNRNLWLGDGKRKRIRRWTHREIQKISHDLNRLRKRFLNRRVFAERSRIIVLIRDTCVIQVQSSNLDEYLFSKALNRISTRSKWNRFLLFTSPLAFGSLFNRLSFHDVCYR